MVNTGSSVFLFIGEDSYLKAKAIDKLSVSVSGGLSTDMDHKVLYGGDTDVTEILSYVNTPPFLSEKRFVVIKEFEKLSKEDKARLALYMEKPSKSAYLVLDLKDDSIIKEHGRIAKHVNVRRFGALTDTEFISWVRQFLASVDKKIDESAIADLKELQGQNLMSLAQELNKLIAFVGERENIGAGDVEELVGKSVEASGFDLGWAVGRKDINGAIKLISDLLVAGRRPQEIIGILCWYFKMLVKAKAFQAKGESDYYISGVLNTRRKQSDELCLSAKTMTWAQLKSKMEILLEADLDIKRTRLDPNLVLEFAAIRLCLT